MLREFERKTQSPEVIEWGRLANENPPMLCGQEVEFHPAWHSLMSLSMEYGLHNLPWTESRSDGHQARATMAMAMSRVEAGHLCPISMTYSSMPVIRRHAELLKELEPRLKSREYGASSGTGAALIGMAMTEKQGGSDVRANTTRAEHITGDEYALHGAKWFCSAPLSDAFLVLAQAPGGLSCFFMPRQKEFVIQRLKPKLGNRSNASSEVEFHGAWARRIGEEGRGVATIIDMVHHTRLDCVMAQAALMREAFVQALKLARERVVFGKLLIQQPLMRNVLADLAIEAEAARLLLTRLARAFDENDRAFARIGVAVGKYWLGKRAPGFVAEALECLGGNGYVEDSIMPRLYREAPLASIWEGSGNVIALDVLRAVKKDPEALEAIVKEIRIGGVQIEVPLEVREEGARIFAESLAVALQKSLMIRCAPQAMADAFCSNRGRAFGTLGGEVDSVIAVCNEIGNSE